MIADIAISVSASTPRTTLSLLRRVEAILKPFFRRMESARAALAEVPFGQPNQVTGKVRSSTQMDGYPVNREFTLRMGLEFTKSAYPLQ